MAKFPSLPILLLHFGFWLFAIAVSENDSDLEAVPASNATLLPPSQDPFYTVPAGFESTVPGSVLRVRHAPGNLTAIYTATAVYNILYRTTDSNYKPSWAVTTLYVPHAAPKSGNATSSSPGLLNFQFAYDGASVDQSPSYLFYTLDQGEALTLNASLQLGWYVNVPDYEGPCASFALGVQAGHAVLDSVRAARHLAPLARRVALYGYSGGGLASTWAAELQEQYAPELALAGLAVGGVPANLTSGIEASNGGLTSQLIVNGILGIATQYPALARYLDEQLKPDGPFNASTFYAARRLQGTNTVLNRAYRRQDVFNYFRAGRGFLQSPAVLDAFYRDGILGYHGVPRMPVYVVHAIKDEIAPIRDVDPLIERYCGVGANILYERNTVGGHLAEPTNTQNSTFAWLQAVLDGSYARKYATRGCTIRNVTMGLDNEAQILAATEQQLLAAERGS